MEERFDENTAIRAIMEGTSSETGQVFFKALVKNLALALNTSGAWVTEYNEQENSLDSLAMWFKGSFISEYKYNIVGTPCEPVINNKELIHVPDEIAIQFPRDPDLKPMDAASYMGAPLLDENNSVMGHLAVIDSKPMPFEPRLEWLFKIFASRAAAELVRIKIETKFRDGEEKLRRLIDSAMDAIFELDKVMTITRVNPSAEKVFQCSEINMIGRNIGSFLGAESTDKLNKLIESLGSRPKGRQYLWIPGGLKARCENKLVFPAEASLSRFEIDGEPFYSLILRNVNDQYEAEREIHSLKEQAAYLRSELKESRHMDNIIGKSPSMQKLTGDINQVAPTDSTVLIQGETGTGKELIAQAIHDASHRSSAPLIKVNCAAVPASLIESEFFGHEKGSFTGATQKREGRFELADGGTIFLDEVGEIPLDLQAKLLRVLQEGEFEPVGSSRTRKVDVRVIAATNRQLHQQVEDGKFRNDLYYRLNVFPVVVPPLRNRGRDVLLLAEAFIEMFAGRMRRRIKPMTASCQKALVSYSWPGNVRELQNIIERAVITSHNGLLNIPNNILTEVCATPQSGNDHRDDSPDAIYTSKEIQSIERENIIRALNQTGWKVSGKDGAARLLEINPSTLASRIKALNIVR